MKKLICVSMSCLAAVPAAAQEFRDPCSTTICAGDVILPVRRINDDEITVVATGNRQLIEQSGQSISVITAREIVKVQGPDITRVLERLPGVTLSRNGGLGSTTSLFVRGANSEQLVVLIDGVRMEDAAAPSGGFDLGTLLPGGIGKIELLRGSNSVAWGSDAIGGVLALTSDTTARLRASAEYGAHDTLTTSAGARLGTDATFLALNGGYVHSHGISAFAGGTEPDGFRQWNVGGSGRVAVTNDVALVATGRYADSRVDFDGYPAPTYTIFADTPEYQTTRQGSGRAGIDYRGNALRLAAGLALSDTRRSYFDPTYGTASNFDTAGRSVRADLTGRYDLGPNLSLDFGGDSEWTRFSTTYNARSTARLTSGHLLLGLHQGRGLNLTAGARIDDHDRFGTHWTFGADGAVGIGGNWRLRASWGQGFKAPTLYQLYGYGGNAKLRPETSESFDVGIEHGDRNGPLHFALTAFRRDSRQLISYLWPSGYYNTGRARAEGVELELGAQISPRLTAGAVYTYVKATDRDTGTELARRPHNAVTLSADWTTPLAGLALGGDLRMVSDSYDLPGNITRLDGYALATLRASLPVGDRFELFARIENLTNARYATAADYGTYRRSAYAGVRARW
ncbi:MAG: TonB-dependent receptor [Proteobacteria bacterium]|nr:TonB-dependent receptor [Pseudomonadota bacterium]